MNLWGTGEVHPPTPVPGLPNSSTLAYEGRMGTDLRVALAQIRSGTAPN